MKVTKRGAKCSQLPSGESFKEGSLQKNSAEHEGYAGVHTSRRITENNITGAGESKDKLLEQILDRDNLNRAFRKLKPNQGAPATAATDLDPLRPYLSPM